MSLTSFDIHTDILIYMWAGMMQGKNISVGNIMQGDKSKNEKRIHPCQKPILIYKYLLQNYAKKGDKIIDTHIGSGSIRIACYDLGFYLDGCENNEKCFIDQENRYNEYVKLDKMQLRLL